MSYIRKLPTRRKKRQRRNYETFRFQYASHFYTFTCRLQTVRKFKVHLHWMEFDMLLAMKMSYDAGTVGNAISDFVEIFTPRFDEMDIKKPGTSYRTMKGRLQKLIKLGFVIAEDAFINNSPGRMYYLSPKGLSIINYFDKLIKDYCSKYIP